MISLRVQSLSLVALYPVGAEFLAPKKVTIYRKSGRRQDRRLPRVKGLRRPEPQDSIEISSVPFHKTKLKFINNQKKKKKGKDWCWRVTTWFLLFFSSLTHNPTLFNCLSPYFAFFYLPPPSSGSVLSTWVLLFPLSKWNPVLVFFLKARNRFQFLRSCELKAMELFDQKPGFRLWKSSLGNK